MKVTEAVVEELARQGVLEIMADKGFDPVEMARAVIKAADGGEVRWSDAFRPRHAQAADRLSPVNSLLTNAA
jgi:hypothetical protein